MRGRRVAEEGVRERLLGARALLGIERQHALQQVHRQVARVREALAQVARPPRRPPQEVAPALAADGLQLAPRRHADGAEDGVELRVAAAGLGRAEGVLLAAARHGRAEGQREERLRAGLGGAREQLGEDAAGAPHVHRARVISLREHALGRAVARRGDRRGEVVLVAVGPERAVGGAAGRVGARRRRAGGRRRAPAAAAPLLLRQRALVVGDVQLFPQLSALGGGVARGARQAEVGDHDAPLGHQHVGRLDVPVPHGHRVQQA